MHAVFQLIDSHLFKYLSHHHQLAQAVPHQPKLVDLLGSGENLLNYLVREVSSYLALIGNQSYLDYAEQVFPYEEGMRKTLLELEPLFKQTIEESHFTASPQYFYERYLEDKKGFRTRNYWLRSIQRFCNQNDLYRLRPFLPFLIENVAEKGLNKIELVKLMAQQFGLFDRIDRQATAENQLAVRFLPYEQKLLEICRGKVSMPTLGYCQNFLLAQDEFAHMAWDKQHSVSISTLFAISLAFFFGCLGVEGLGVQDDEPLRENCALGLPYNWAYDLTLPKSHSPKAAKITKLVNQDVYGVKDHFLAVRQRYLNTGELPPRRHSLSQFERRSFFLILYKQDEFAPQISANKNNNLLQFKELFG